MGSRWCSEWKLLLHGFISLFSLVQISVWRQRWTFPQEDQNRGQLNYHVFVPCWTLVYIWKAFYRKSVDLGSRTFAGNPRHPSEWIRHFSGSVSEKERADSRAGINDILKDFVYHRLNNEGCSGTVSVLVANVQCGTVVAPHAANPSHQKAGSLS